MADDKKATDFTVFIEGHEGHQGNVLGHAYVTKLSKLLAILGRMERAYLEAGNRKTDFEIIDTRKYNPTTMTFKPVSRAKNYNPLPALDWSLEQIEIVGRGQMPDTRVKSALAKDLADISRESRDNSYGRFWINGHAEPIHFNDEYSANALKVASKLAHEETPDAWFVGQAEGEVVGRLEKIDNLDADHEFVIVPPVGAEQIVCKFPNSMEDEVGRSAFKMVRLRGTIHYNEYSPHPHKIVLSEGGISLITPHIERPSLKELRGIFKGIERKPFKLEDAL